MIAMLAVVVTLIIAGPLCWYLGAEASRRTVLSAMGARPGGDVMTEHQRLLDRARGRTDKADALAEQLRLSLDALSLGVTVADKAGDVVVRNSLARTVGTTSSARTLIDATIGGLIDQAVRGQACERELEVSGPPSRTLHLHAVPILVDENVVGALAITDDVTDHQRVEKTRRDFVANLSHELRTPVGALSLLVEMLKDEHDLETRSQLFDRVLIETDRLANTIDDLLELSRIESRTQDFGDLVDMHQVVTDGLERTRVAAESAGVSVGHMLPATTVHIRGNADQLLSALVNLVENAIKYSEHGDTVTVSVRLRASVISLIVSDTGRGIPERDLDRIFERFYRVDRSRESGTGGTGIGLSIVRHVALNHGGSVTVDSFEGEGSTFTIELPWEPEPETVTELRSERA